MKKQILKSGRGVLCILAAVFAFLVSGNIYASTNEPLNNLPETTEVQEVDRTDDALVVYDGYIGKYPIRMALNFDTKTGYYYYKSKGSNNKLYVEIGYDAGYTFLFEYNQNGQQTGLFRGTFRGNTFSGVFLATQTGKKYNFKVTEKY
ncbi:MAG: hypothetical protein IIU50_01185 [Bacteroidaceae bacterium]|nr:hypothetical protein [Bacteroidaceae bacterium]MBQ5370147.1 hypothetical protein [Bacteroidaceae bacterium]MBQ5826051.1 hypothetical protein [Bacteroidaceae bacterium]